ncbi:hypothetical protein I550_4889 [Mycobacterium intracellulare 1956]|uniref:Uncharacterized protein n=1 Tax=Mycobacterium intracellulare 1956 TaxID=1299331 RepID=X8CAY6_MYCIT|nr:hypothetical protein I548_4075 [Mycobacterium intracellulare]EUA28637.1 hypothetical protein I548_1821 [Mycobacterium intracellulare]EUA53254.1 hypothetical protein I550_4889 [Mycobacterium intracellulare 1956]
MLMTGQPQLLSVQRRYWELIASGVSSEDAGLRSACRRRAAASGFAGLVV